MSALRGQKQPFANRRLWNFDRARLPLCARTSALCQSRSWQAYRNRSLAAQRQKAHYDVYCSIALSQASLLRSKSISAYCSLAIKQDYGQWAPLLIQAWTNSPADS